MVCANAGKPFTYADIQKGTFAQKSVPAPRSMANGLSYTALNKGKVVRYSYATGQLEGVMFDNGSVKPAITPSGYQLSPDEKTILLETNVNPIYRHSYTADYYLYVIETGELKPLLTEEEMGYFRRGKNAHTHAAPKSATPQEYAKATGLEALFGALYLLGRTERINELFNILMEDQNGI